MTGLKKILNTKILTIFLIFYATAFSSQRSREGINAPKDSLKILLALGSSSKETNPSKSLAYYLQALNLAGNKGDLNAEIEILDNIIEHYNAIENPGTAAKYRQEKIALYTTILSGKKGADKIPVLLSLGDELADNNTDSSLYYNKKALELSRFYNLDKYEGKSLVNLGEIYSETGDLMMALESFNQALKIFNSVKDSLSITGLFWKIGKIYLGFKLYNQALDYQFTSLKLAEKIHNRTWIYNSLREIGTIYYHKNNPAEGQKYFDKLTKMAYQNGDFAIISLIYHTLGKYYYSKNAYEKAAVNFEHAAKLRYKNKEPYDRLIMSYENLGESYRKLGKYEKALNYMNKAYVLCKKSNYGILTQRLQKELGITYKYLNNYQKSVHFLKESINTAQRINYTKNIASGFQELSMLYFKMNKFKEAYGYLNKYLTIQDSLWAIGYKNGVGQLKKLYIAEKRATQYEALKTKNKNELLIAFGLIFILTLLISIILYSRYRFKVHSNLLLKNKAKELSKALDELSQLNEVLKISETTYRYLFEKNPLPMLIWDKDSLKIISANFAAMGLYGYSLDEFQNMIIKDIFEAEKRDKTDFKNLSKYMQKIIDIKHIKKDGSDIDVEMVIHPLIFDGKRAYNSMINDVTEKKHIENAIIESERRLSRAQKIANVGNWEIDLKTQTVMGSEEAFFIYGLDSSKWDHLDYEEIKTLPFKEDREILDKALHDLLTGNKEYNIEFRIHKKDTGEERVIGSTAEVIRNENGEPVKVTGVIRDITEIKNYQKELIEAKERAERSDKLKSDFLAQMSHEIRSPVNIILSFASLLKEELNGNINEDINTCFNSIDSGGRRLIRTIDLILNTADLQSGKYEPFMEETDLEKDIVKNLIMEFMSAANAKGLEIRFINNLECRRIKTDRYTVTQIFANLIDNAIKYTKQGSIIIELFESGDEISASVSDTGIGISEEYLPRLFDPFSQEEQGYARRFEGTGLGLSLVKKYCDLNNARIKVDSIKGKGTTFTIVFRAETEVEV